MCDNHFAGRFTCDAGSKNLLMTLRTSPCISGVLPMRTRSQLEQVEILIWKLCLSGQSLSNKANENHACEDHARTMQEPSNIIHRRSPCTKISN